MDMQTVFGLGLVVVMVFVVIKAELNSKKHVADLKKVADEAAANLAKAKADFEAKLKAYTGSK